MTVCAGRPGARVGLSRAGPASSGTALTRRLLADGARVRVLARSRRQGQAAGGPRRGNRRRRRDRPRPPSASRWTARGSSTTSPDRCSSRASRRAEYLRAHVLGTTSRARLLRAGTRPRTARALQHHGCARSDRRPPGRRRTRRSGRPTSTSRRRRARRRWSAGDRDRGLPAVIARPGLVYGPGDIHLVSFFQAIQRHRVPADRPSARLAAPDLHRRHDRGAGPLRSADRGDRRVLPPRGHGAGADSRTGRT